MIETARRVRACHAPLQITENAAIGRLPVNESHCAVKRRF